MGPPGCGKTFISEALATEVGVSYIYVSPVFLTLPLPLSPFLEWKICVRMDESAEISQGFFGGLGVCCLSVRVLGVEFLGRFLVLKK
ncbi:MAG: AAA family ATPase [Bacteroidaceae bacterium]|nr:AAA family ATPase [Bacteroidaceae bacterium]